MGCQLGFDLDDMLGYQWLGVDTTHACTQSLLQERGFLVGGDARDEWVLMVSCLVQLVYLYGGLRTIEVWHAKVAENDSVEGSALLEKLLQMSHSLDTTAHLVNCHAE